MEIGIVTKFVIDKFKSNPLVNTISVAKQSEIDFNKANIYPLVNIDIIQSEVLESNHRVTYTINVLQQRDLTSEMNLNNKLLNTNMIDNLNEAYSIASKFINNIRSYNNEQGIELTSVTPITMVKYSGTNLLDGVLFTMVLEVEDFTGC